MPNLNSQFLGYEEIIDTLLNPGAASIVKLMEACGKNTASNTFQKDFNKVMNEICLQGCRALQSRFPTHNELAKCYYRKRIFPILSPSVFYRRAYEKPRGYPGDFLMMDMLYQCCPLPNQGSHPISDYFDNWFLNTPSACACRNRKGFMSQALADYENAGVKTVASLASGPCREACEFLENRSGKENGFQFFFFDFDEEALNYGRNLLQGMNRNKSSFRFIQTDLTKLVLGKRSCELPRMDLVYCNGFADYISDKLLIRLLEFVYTLLTPGGSFILCQFVAQADHPDEFSMKWGLDWHLTYRTPERLAEIFSESPFGGNVAIETEALGLIMFAEGKKI